MNNVIRNGKYISHPLLKNEKILFREYQVSMGNNASKQNTLVVLPTSLGKTIIALFSLVNIFQNNPNGRIFILAPTRPLVVQHFETFQNFLNPFIKCCLFSSNLSVHQRTLALNDFQVFFSTPQIIQNDLIGEMYNLEGISQIIFDETHKARKKYAYTFVAERYLLDCPHPKILGLTASPGSDLFRINDLCQTLQIEKIIFRERENLDIQKYVHPISSTIHNINLPDEILKAKLILDTAIRNIRDYMVQNEILPKRNYTSKFQFIQLIQDLKKLEILLDPYRYDNKNDYNAKIEEEEVLNFPHLLEIFDPNINDTIPNRTAVFSRAINGIYLEHLKEILTTQDVRMFWNYLKKLQNRAEMGNRRVKQFLHSKHIFGIKKILTTNYTSPKIPVMIKIIEEELSQNSKAKFIVFTQYREMGSYLTQEINSSKDLKKFQIKANRFVGQASKLEDKGLNQREQGNLIKAFKQNNFQVLIATSVAEEGLDIPNVSAIIFYDMVPSEIRLIQRRGRTGRHEPGKCHYLVNNDSLDVIYNSVSHRKEQKMRELLKNPHLVQTVEALPRSLELPNYKKKTQTEINEAVKNRKIVKAQQSMVKIEEALQKHSTKLGHLVTDMTSELTHHTFSHQKPTVPKSKSNIITPMKYMTKKYFKWIYSTMEILGTMYNDYLYCDLDELYQAVDDEEMNALKIQQEIDKGVQHKIFKVENSQLILILSFAI